MTVTGRARLLLVAALACGACGAFAPAPRLCVAARSARRAAPARLADDDLETVTEKYGLEAGLFSALKKGGGGGDDASGEKKGGMATAGDLLKRYGGAYLLTSTSLALVSFSLCYAAINAGVDVSALLQARGMAHARAPRRSTPHSASAAAQKVGIEVSSTSEKVGTVGLAYAVHKAASPIRFPPTVALTPVVARTLFGKKDDDDASADEAAE